MRRPSARSASHQGPPILDLENPVGLPTALQRKGLDVLRELNQRRYEQVHDPEIASRIANYELAFRMQTEAPAITDLSTRARAKQLSPDDVDGGTFTITNPGVFGSVFGLPIINQPQSAILCVGVIEKRPIVDTDSEGNDVISIKTMSYFSITYDHRLVDGADADEFMNDVKHTLTNETWNELDPYM